MDKIGLVRFLSSKPNKSIRNAQKSNYDNTQIHCNVEQLTTPAHNIAPHLHPISWPFSRSSCNGKEKDYESGFHYYGARYYWSEMLTGWLSVDPMMDKYPNISSYNYCVWNPVKLVDPDGEDCIDDIVIRGVDNSSLTIKTSAIDLTIHTDKNFGGNHVIDASSSMLAIGYEVGVDATGSAVFQSSGTAYMQSVMFLGGDYSGYWYDYIGGETQMNVSNSVEGTVGVHKNWFLGIYTGDKKDCTPSSFAGRYFGGDYGFSGNFLASGLSLDGSWAKSELGNWKTLSFGISFSLGPQFDLGSEIIGGYGGGNLGGTNLITPQKKTRNRTCLDRFFNLISH